MKEKALNRAEKQRLERAFKVLDNPIFSTKKSIAPDRAIFLFMEHYSCYILYSKKLDRYYVGHTRDIEQRLMQHNTAIFLKLIRSRAALSKW